jgi:hypothetical protein
MAVELCKVAIWIETVEPGKPLSFLDSHIRNGDDALATLDAIPEDSVDEIEAKQRCFEGLRSGGIGSWLRQACDLWTAAFFTPKAEMPASRGHELTPTTDKVWQYLRGITLYGPLMVETDRCAQHYHFFHWPIEFPGVMAMGGFDLVLGNPPWE